MQSYKKILVIRFSSIGDIVLTTPVLRCLKQQLKAEIHFLTKPSFAGVIATNPNIDRVFLLKDSINETIAELRNENYDLIVDLHKNLRSYRISWSLMKKTIRYDKLNIAKWLYVKFKWNRLPKNLHLVDRYFQSLAKIGVKDDGLGLDYFINEADSEQSNQLTLDLNYQVLVLGATYYTKRIPKVKCIEIISLYPKTTVLVGGKDVTELASALKELFPDKVIDHCGKVNLGTSAGIIRNSVRVVTGDTGMMHIAAALQKRICVIWGSTTPLFGMYPFYGKNNEDKHTDYEVKDLYCRPCSKLGFNECPEKHFRCMMDNKMP